MMREQLEQQAEADRAAVADTLEELNRRLTPGELLDQVLAYSKDGGMQFLGNLGKQITDNPMPVTLIGAGLAWFLFGKNASAGTNGKSYGGTQHMFGDGASSMNSSGIGDAAGQAADKIGDAASSAANKIGGMASSAASGAGSAMQSAGDAATGAMKSVGDAATGAMQSVGGAASGAMQTVGDTAANVYYSATDKLSMMKDSAIQAEEKTMAAARSAIEFCQDQPLILAGAGLAIGAAIGAAFPVTEMENRLIGETADDLKETAKDLAVTQLDKAKAIGGKLGEVLQDEAAKAASQVQAGQDKSSQDKQNQNMQSGESDDRDLDADEASQDDTSSITSQYARPNGSGSSSGQTRGY